MSRRACRLPAIVLCLLACAALAVSFRTVLHDVRTEDGNRDGRPDIWRAYDRQGRLATIAVDTNFDGRSDVHEYYRRGALVRRESDRDFNDHVDLVQEFDATTRQALRSVSDVDFDGVADLLVLFEGGRPVYSRWADAAAPAAVDATSTETASLSPRTTQSQLTDEQSADHQLAPLDDPFRADRAVSAVYPSLGFGDYVGLATSGGLPQPCCRVASPFATSSSLPNSRTSSSSSPTLVQYSPRGPPLRRLPS
jgi:hypothetical protein